MSRFWPLLALVLISCLGCSGDPGKNPDAIELTGTVKLNGKPLTNVVLHLQPTGGGHPVETPVVDGKVKALVTPGKYCYFITEGESPEAFKAIPKEYHTPTLELRDEIVVDSSTTSLEIDLE